MIFSDRIIKQKIALSNADPSRLHDFLALFVYKNLIQSYALLTRKIKAIAAKKGNGYYRGFRNDIDLAEKYYPWLLIGRNRMPYYKLRCLMLKRGNTKLKHQSIAECSMYCRVSKYIPVEMITEDIIYHDVRNYPKIMKLLPGKLHDGYLIPHNPTDNNWCTRLITEIIDRRPGYLACVPGHLKTPEIVHVAVRDVPGMLRFVPRRLQTFELCRRAYRQSGSVERYIKIANFHEMLANCG